MTSVTLPAERGAVIRPPGWPATNDGQCSAARGH